MYKIIHIFFFLFILLSNINSVLYENNFFIDESETLRDLFTVNIGIMQLKKIGNLSIINPLDSDRVVNHIYDELEKVPNLKLTRKSATIRALRYFLLKNKDLEKKLDFMEKLFIYSERINNQDIAKLLKEFKKKTEFALASKKWLEYKEQSYYTLNILKPGDRILYADPIICQKIGAAENKVIDFLFSGTIEKINNQYLITIYVYSANEDKVLEQFSIATESDQIPFHINRELKKIIPRIFHVDYAGLEVITGDEEANLFINDQYIGKQDVVLEYLIPGQYVITLQKQGFYDQKTNLTLNPFENKKINLQLEQVQKLQTVHFYIEPLGTKIFLNAVYQGRSPFKKALPEGNYVVSARNDLYQNYRYTFSINEVKDETLNIVFHLLSKDLSKEFKIRKYLYYSAFWNFTFSLTATIPILIFSVYYFYMWQSASLSYNRETGDIYYYTPEGRQLKSVTDLFYGLAAGFITHTVLSAVWLFIALGRYIKILEKKDFIPIMHYYQRENGEQGLVIGGEIKIKNSS